MLIEGLGSATIVNGVMRIETLYRNARGEDAPGDEMIIPINRVTAIVAGLQALIEKAEEASSAPAEPLEIN